MTSQPERHPSADRSALVRTLDMLERMGNRLPDPISLFALFAVLVVALSWVCSHLGVSAIHPKDGSTVMVVDLLTRENVRRMFTDAVKNFMGFAPLGVVLVAMLGVGVAEGSGLIAAALRAFVLRMPRNLLTASVVLAGLLSHVAADAGIVILPPLAALLFAASGRHPLAGLAAAFAGVAGGFSANLLPAPLDAVLAGLSQEALTASKLLPGYQVQMLGNYFFLAASTPLLVAVGTWVTHSIVEPRLGPWHGPSEMAGALGADERRGLKAAGWATLTMLVLIGALALMPNAPLAVDTGSSLERFKPLLESIVVVIALLFFVPGVAYGIATGKVKSDHDVAKLTSDSIASMAGYIVIAFVAAQFINYFAWSNLGAILAIRGAEQLKLLGLDGAGLMVSFILFTAAVDMLVSSASAKWAIMAPVFVPMLVLLGYTPEATQAIYRVGDSCVNIITPLLPYMPFILATARRYDPKAGSGTLVALMLPYSAVFLVAWTALLLVFYFAHWPLGPGVPFHLPR
ncbi:MAG: AbgT family transporter [Candidatus Eisenbacteria bacterium]